MKLAIVKYNAGNIQSVLNALERIGVAALVTDDHELLRSVDKVIFPGVGEASSAMKSLKEKDLDKLIRELKQPLLGICVGMQLLYEFSEENNTDCLGIIPGKVKLFMPATTDNPELNGILKVPQIGWNTVYQLKTDLFKNVPENSFVYFVHSYYGQINPFCIARAGYGIEYAAAVKKDNFYGVQFHTEKSAATGEQILKNFLSLT